MTQIDISLHKQQTKALEIPANELLYGGAAGGGKSHLMRVVAIILCSEIPGLQVYLFRRHYADLYKNHLEGAGSFTELLAPWIESKFVKIVENEIRFWNNAKVHLCHCQHEKDVLKYQGAEIHVLLMDELTHFTEKIYRFLRGRCRLGGLDVPEKYKSKLPLILAGSNPGGIGHNWVKRTFVDFAPPMACHAAPRSEGGMVRCFIPAKLEDNPTLLKNDPDYEIRLEGLGNPALVKAMRNGEWNIVAGGAFDDVWSDRVIIPKFNVPKGWRVDRSFDWGSSKPFSVGWWAESDGTEAIMSDGSKFCPPRGTLVRIAEWYGTREIGTDEGLKLSASEIAQGVLSFERDMMASGQINALANPGPADNQITSSIRANIDTIAQEMAKHGVTWTESDKSPGSRVNGLELVRSRLREASKEIPEAPALYIVDSCRATIATIPTLPRAKNNPDDVDSSTEDHIYDEIRYRVLHSKHVAMDIKLGFAR